MVLKYLGRKYQHVFLSEMYTAEPNWRTPFSIAKLHLVIAEGSYLLLSSNRA